MSRQFAVDDMAYDVLETIRQDDRFTSLDYTHGYAALVDIAGPLSCAVFGHPNQPRSRLRKFAERPWRCARCGTWWVTEHYTSYANYDSGGAWRWVRVWNPRKDDDHA